MVNHVFASGQAAWLLGQLIPFVFGDSLTGTAFDFHSLSRGCYIDLGECVLVFGLSLQGQRTWVSVCTCLPVVWTCP